MPITAVTIGLAVAGFLGVWLTERSLLFSLWFDPEAGLPRAWTAATYALVEWRPIGVLFSCLVAFFFMGAMERAWGRSRFLPAFAILWLLPPVGYALGWLLTAESFPAFGLTITSGAWVVVFATYRPQAVIHLMGMFPIKAFWVGWASAILIVVGCGTHAPLFGAACAVIPLAAFALGRGRLTLPSVSKKTEFKDEFRRSLATKRDAELERKRLRDLLERSISDEDEEA